MLDRHRSLDIVHLIGRRMPGHIPHKVPEETLELLRLITQPLAPKGGAD